MRGAGTSTLPGIDYENLIFFVRLEWSGMRIQPLSVVITSLTLALFLFTAGTVQSASCEASCEGKSGGEKLACLSEVKQACETQLNQIGAEKQSLTNTISYLNTQIAYTQSRINETTFQIEQLEEEIRSLSGKISVLTNSLETLTRLLLSRISATYKQTRIHPLALFFSSDGVKEFINRYRYLRAVQLNDRQILYETERTRATYDAQKTLKEEKQTQVLGLQTELIEQKGIHDQQKKEKQFLLKVTENDEKKYQELLAKAQAELAAIQAIISGLGDEEEVKEVGEGDKIATIMTGGPNLYACSTGPHLHFEVVKDQVTQNPFGLLQSKSLIWDNPDSGQNGSGSWRWPLEDPIRVTQSFGETSYSSRYAGGIHTGIDMTNDDNRNVKAVKRGTLFRGGISCRGGTLQYVRVKHAEDGHDTYYLHVDYY